MFNEKMIAKFGANNGAATFLLSPPDDIQQVCVAEFIHEFGGSLDPVFWSEMVLEEAQELEESYDEDDFVNCAKELADLRYVMIGMVLCMGPSAYTLINPQQHTIMENLARASEAVELFLAEAGPLYPLEDMDETFYRVHESNMSKLDRNGQPIRNERGKVQKGPDYMPPTLDDLFQFEFTEVEPNTMKEAA